MPPDPTAHHSEEDDLILADKQVVEKAKDILNCMANAVSAMKIFPSDHSTVKNFVDVLIGKFDAYFKTYQKLQVGVEEFSFTCADRVVYTDEMAIKSLPFFFFKDGMQILYFYRGLERQELFEFLEQIKSVSQRPGGDNDIVAALWECDFSSIQYYAPDEFLETQILAEKEEDQAGQPADLAQETLEIKVDLAKFSEGRIELTSEDRKKFLESLQNGEHAKARAAEEEPAPPQPMTSPDESSGITQSPAASMESHLTEKEVRELEDMVKANRVLCPEEEFINLTAEVVFLEEDLQVCSTSLDVLVEFHFGQIKKGNFPVAIGIVQKVQELESHIGAGGPQKAALLGACRKKLTGATALEAVKTRLDTKAPVDMTSLLGFFRMLGPAIIPMAAALFEEHEDSGIKARILAFIEESGQREPGLLAGLANDARPALSLAVIGMLFRMPGNKGISHFSAFLMFKNRDIKLEAIRALGRMQDEMAARILMGFLNDPDESLRIQAARKLKSTEDKSRIVHIIHEASTPEFRKKSLREKQAILSFLGRTGFGEVLEFLSGTLKKTTFLPSAQNREMRLASVAGLESMRTAEAAAALEAGARARGKIVRRACAEALARTRDGIPPES